MLKVIVSPWWMTEQQADMAGLPYGPGYHYWISALGVFATHDDPNTQIQPRNHR